MFGISAFSQSPYSSLAGGTLLGVAVIAATATVTVVTVGTPVFGTAGISGTGTFTAVSSGQIISGNGSISGTAY